MAVCHVFIHIKMIYFIAEIIEEEAIAPKATGKAIPQVEKSYRDKGQDTSSHFEHVSCGLMKTNKKNEVLVFTTAVHLEEKRGIF